MIPAELQRAKMLLDAIIAAKDWHDTFAINAGDESAQVEFSDVWMCKIPVAGLGSGPRQGFEGGLVLPREVAIAMMAWLQDYARSELERLGVNL